MGCNQQHLEATLPKRRFYFIKPLIGDFVDRLRIPPAFVKKHLKHIHCNKVTLENPDRRHWHVTLERTNDGVFLQNGWKKFLEDHSLQIGEILVFGYIGNSHFTVQMFDRTCCEKECFFYRTNHEEPNKETEKKMEVRRTKIQNHHVHQCRACTAKNEEKRERLSASKNVHTTQKMHRIVKEGQMVNKSNACVKDYLFGSPNGKGTNKKNQKKGQLKEEEIQNQDGRQYIARTTKSDKKRKRTCSSINVHLTGKKSMIVEPSDKRISNPIFSKFLVKQENQEQEVLKEETTRKENAREQPRKKPVRVPGQINSSGELNCVREGSKTKPISSCILSKDKGVHRPSFRVVMTRAYVSSGFSLHLPAKFRKDYFPKKSREITLHDPSGRKWPVKYLEQGTLSAGWRRFSLENNLKEGDTCVFQLVDQNFSLDICIIRVVNKSRQMSIRSSLSSSSRPYPIFKWGRFFYEYRNSWLIEGVPDLLQKFPDS